MIETFKLVHGFYDKTVAPPLPLRADSSARPLRGHPLLLQTERNTTARRRSSFTQRVVPLWNSLSWEVVKPSTVNTFKNRLDNAWEGQAFFYNYKEYPTGARLSATIYWHWYRERFFHVPLLALTNLLSKNIVIPNKISVSYKYCVFSILYNSYLY